MDKYTFFDALSPIIGRPFVDKKHIPIIYYHSVVDSNGESYQHISIDRFKEHMLYLKNSGYSFLSFTDAPLEFKKSINEKKVIVAFDDGYVDNYTLIYDFMINNGLKYNIFLAMSFVGKEGYLSVSQIETMKSSGIVGFGVHTYSHINCVDDIDKLPYELDLSNQMYECILGQKPTDFCFPYGAYSFESIRYIIDNHIYQRIYTSDSLKPVSIDGSVVTGRLGIRNEDSIAVLKHKLLGLYYPLRLIEKKVCIRRRGE